MSGVALRSYCFCWLYPTIKFFILILIWFDLIIESTFGQSTTCPSCFLQIFSYADIYHYQSGNAIQNTVWLPSKTAPPCNSFICSPYWSLFYFNIESAPATIKASSDCTRHSWSLPCCLLQGIFYDHRSHVNVHLNGKFNIFILTILCNSNKKGNLWLHVTVGVTLLAIVWPELTFLKSKFDINMISMKNCNQYLSRSHPITKACIHVTGDTSIERKVVTFLSLFVSQVVQGCPIYHTSICKP